MVLNLDTAPAITIWVMVESGLGLIAASLPTLRPLFRSLRSRVASKPSTSSRYTPNWTGIKGSSGQSGSKLSGMKSNITSRPGEEWISLSGYGRNGVDDLHTPLRSRTRDNAEDEENQIRVKTDLRISSAEAPDEAAHGR